MRLVHSTLLIFSIGAILFLNSCKPQEVIAAETQVEAEEVPVIDEEIIEPEVIEEGKSEEQEKITEEEVIDDGVVDQRTVTGSFKSVDGTTDPLSCFCFYSGYVTTAEGDKIAVCFDRAVQSCDKITVTGYRTSKKVEENGTCSGGRMGFLKAQNYTIGETEF